MKPPELCDVCGLNVSTEEAVRAELAPPELMCPTAMVFHPACYEQASEMWKPDPDSTCVVDTMFPETAQWPRAEAPSS